MVSCVLFFMTNVTISTSISQTFPSSNIPSSPAYGVFNSRSYSMPRLALFMIFFFWGVRLSCKLRRQGYVRKRLKSSFRKFYGQYWDLIKHYEVPSHICYMAFWDMIIYRDTLHWSDISPNRDFVTELNLITVYDVITLFQEVSKGHLQPVRLVNRGHLLLRTPGPDAFCTCIYSNVLIILSWTFHVCGPFDFRTLFVTNVPLFCFQQIVGISMGANFAPLLSDIFLYSYEAEIPEMVDQWVPEGTCSQVLRSTSVDS